MASAKQIAWRKKFARMSKAGKFRKKKTGTKGAKSDSKFDEKAWRRKVEESRMELDKWTKEKFKGKSDADLRRIIRTKKGNTDDEGHELGRRMHRPPI